jgi:hypothetical protein
VLTIYNNGSGLAIDSAGEVGIGTTSPGAKLNVLDTADTVTNQLSNSNYAAAFLGDDGGVTGDAIGILIGANNSVNRGVAILAEKQGSGNQHDMIFATSAGSATPTERMRIDDAGNVGIGTTDPTASLHVVGVGYFQADGAQFGSADLVSDAAIVIPEDDFIYTADGTPGSANLRRLIGKQNDAIIIGASGTSLIDEIRFQPGATWDGVRGFTSFYNNITEVARFTGDGLGIGTTNPAEKLTVDSGNILVRDTANQPAIGTEKTNNVPHLHAISPGGAFYSTTTSTVTGAIEITLPSLITSTNGMLTAWIDIYDYAGGTLGESISVFVAGYAYSVSPTYWFNCAASVITNRTDKNFTVRFAEDGTNHKIYIGELGSTWNYPQVQIRDVQVGFSGGTAANFLEGWTVAFESVAFDNIEQVVTPHLTATKLLGTGADGDNEIVYMNGTTGEIQGSSAFTFTGAGGSGTGNLFVSADTDSYADIGRTRIGYSAYSDHANFSHVDRTGTGQYAVLQAANGTTYLNAPSGQSIRFRINNSAEGLWNSTGLRIGDETAPSYTLDVNGTFRTTGAGRFDSNLTASYFGVGDGNDGYFYSDANGRTAFRNGDFYIRSEVSNYYNYATNQYIGNTSGDNIYFRGNTLTGDSWTMTGAGALSITGITMGGVLITESGDRSGIIEFNRSAEADAYAGVGIKFSTTSEFQMMASENLFGHYDDENNDWMTQYDENGAFRLYYNGSPKLATTSAGITVTGTGTATDFLATSDIRLKNVIDVSVPGLETVMSMLPIRHTWKDQRDTKEHLGFSAQDMKKLVPEVVESFTKNESVGSGLNARSVPGEDYLTISYGKLVPVLVKAIQELTEEVRELKKKVEE